MDRNQRTLVALSGTVADRPLVAYARLLADLGFARHYHFVQVHTPAADQQSGAQLLAACEELVAAHFTPVRPDVAVRCHVEVGVRMDSLIEFSVQHHCDLILLGHRARRSRQRSLARRLAMIAPCSVWMVPENAPAVISSIMAPIDFSDHSADGVAVAAAIARAAGLEELSATHVFADPSTVRHDEHIDAIRKNEEDSFEHFTVPLNTHSVRIEPTFVEGNNVARTILHRVKRHGTDLLVMSTRGRSRAASILLGSVTSQVMTEAPIAVFAVKHFGAVLNLFQTLRQSQFWTRRNPKTN